MLMLNNCLYEFRVSKYYRDCTTGKLLFDQWTSISDVGKVFNGRVLTYAEYQQSENRYLLLIRNICLLLNITQLQITSLENPFNLCPYPNDCILESVDQIVDVATACLRERYWCKLQSSKLFFHFGYDFYLYIGSPLDFTQMSSLVSNLGLFIEKKNSPYT